MKNKILKITGNFDDKLQTYFDRIIPKNLTFRYIGGLALIAILSVAGHIYIRICLAEITFDERMIRKVETQITKSETFYREVIYLQTVNNEKVYRDRVAALDNAFSAVVKNHHILLKEMNRASSSFAKNIEDIKSEVEESYDFLEASYNRVRDLSSRMGTSTVQLDNPILISFIRSENTYRDFLSKLNEKYEIDANDNLDFFKKIETLLLLMILLTIILEGLYVFRPAVKRVYSAIQLRSDFLSKLSHEIRNPMNSILGMAQLLSRTKMTSQQSNYLKILENSGNGLLEMLNDLLDYSSLEAGKIQIESVKTDLYSIIDKSVDLVTVKIQEKNLEFVIEINKRTPLIIFTDPIKLQQVIVNLLSNAAKFTDTGFVKLSVNFVFVDNENLLLISVQDSGVGIERSKVDSIFDSFVQENSSIRRKYGGTGLGLSIAKEILNLMNGDISVKTKKGEGSTFTATIPLIFPKDSKTLEKFIPSKLTGKRYLIIDEHEINTNAVCKLVKDFDGTVDRLKTNLSFIDILNELNKQPFDKILIDSSTFGKSLEDLIDYLVKGKIAKNKICILFRYIHTTYLFDLLSSLEIDHAFPKPIKPIEFINYLSGESNVEEIGEVYEEEFDSYENRYKILIAEDSADNRMLLQLYLENFPADLFFAENGVKAVELFELHRFNIVLMDIQMPEMDGKTAAARIRSIEKKQKLVETPILAFSAHKPEEINYEEGIVLFNDFVVKPVNSQTVKAKLSQYLRQSQRAKDKPKPKPKSKAIQVDEDIDLSDLIPLYLERREKDLEQIEVHFNKSEFDLIARLGHQIKGTAKSYGFEDFGVLAQGLEKYALESDKEGVISTLTEMKSRVKVYQKNNTR